MTPVILTTPGWLRPGERARRWSLSGSSVSPLLVAMAGSTLMGCGGGPGVPSESAFEQRSGGSEVERSLLVLAASSLVEVLPRAVESWPEASSASIRFSFDATSRLTPQLQRGAEADLFVAADRRWMEWALERGLVREGSAVALASNELVLIRGAGARGGPDRPDDARGWEEVQYLALAGENVPAGRYARAALESAGLWGRLESKVVRGGSVRGALEWVARGEADHGIVYRTDVLGEPRAEIRFALPARPGAEVVYYAAVTTASAGPERAGRLLAHLAGSSSSRAAFRSGGFSPPHAPAQPIGAAPARRADPGPDPPVDATAAIRLSLLVALATTVVGFLPALFLGWVLARRDFPGRTLLSTAVLVPLVLPPVVTGFLLLGVFGRSTLLGGVLARLGLAVPFTLVGAVIAAFVVGLPLYVVAIRGAFESVDHRLEELSWTLGHPPASTFVRVTLPLALPGIVAGAVLAFARALGEFGATVVLAGNVEGQTRTIALAVYTLLESPGGRGVTWTLVGASIALSAGALLAYEALSRRQRSRLRR